MPVFPNGFAAGTRIMTARGPVNIEDLKPNDMIQGQPVEQKPADQPPKSPEQQPRWWESASMPIKGTRIVSIGTT